MDLSARALFSANVGDTRAVHARPAASPLGVVSHTDVTKDQKPTNPIRKASLKAPLKHKSLEDALPCGEAIRANPSSLCRCYVSDVCRAEGKQIPVSEEVPFVRYQVMLAREHTRSASDLRMHEHRRILARIVGR